MAWFYAKHGKQEGPVEESVLRSKLTSGELGSDDLVWREGMGEWTPVGKVAALQPGVPPSSPAPVQGGPEVQYSPQPASPGEGVFTGGEAPASPAPGPVLSVSYGASLQAQPAPGLPMIAGPPPTSGLAIASMVCGIISLMSCYVWALVGIPAVICGHMALKAIRQSPHAIEGRGMAMAGLITGYISILLEIGFIILLVVVFSSGQF